MARAWRGAECAGRERGANGLWVERRRGADVAREATTRQKGRGKKRRLARFLPAPCESKGCAGATFAVGTFFASFYGKKRANGQGAALALLVLASAVT